MPANAPVRAIGALLFLLGGCAETSAVTKPAASPEPVLGEVRETFDRTCPGTASAALTRVPARVIAAPVGCAPQQSTRVTDDQIALHRSTSLFVLDDRASLERRTACALFAVDFAKEAVAVFTTSHASNADVHLEGAVSDGEKVTLLFRESSFCQGIPTQMAQTTRMVAFERAPGGVEAEICYAERPMPCPSVP